MNIKKLLKSGYRLRRDCWSKGKFIFCDVSNTVRDQDWNGYHDGITGDDWVIIY